MEALTDLTRRVRSEKFLPALSLMGGAGALLMAAFAAYLAAARLVGWLFENAAPAADLDIPVILSISFFNLFMLTLIAERLHGLEQARSIAPRWAVRNVVRYEPASESNRERNRPAE
jgi:hypothetical protein